MSSLLLWAQELLANAPRIALLVLLFLIALLCLGLWSLLRQAQRRADLAGDDLLTSSDACPNPHPWSLSQRILDLRWQALQPNRPRALGIDDRKLQRALGSGSPYKTPIFLLLGPRGSGATSVVRSAHLSPLSGASSPNAMVRWWLSDQAAVLEADGRLVLEKHNTQSDHAGWMDLLAGLEHFRPRRPVDGIVLVLSVHELLSHASSERRANYIARRADKIRSKLLQAQDRLAMRLPVLLLFSHCDRIEGFQDFYSQIPEDATDQMFGWAAPSAATTHYAPTWIPTCFESLTQALADSQAPPAAPSVFSKHLSDLAPAVQQFTDTLFAPVPGYEPFPLRGIYWCGAPSGSVAPEGQARHPDQVDFVQELFPWKVFYEWSLAEPTTGARKSRRRQRRRWAMGVLSLAFLGPLMLLWGYHRTGARSDLLASSYLGPAAIAMEGGADRAQTTQSILKAGSSVPSYRLGTFLLPYSFVSPFRRQVDRASGKIFADLVMPRLQEDLDLKERSATERLAPIAVSVPVTHLTSTPEYLELMAASRELADVLSGATHLNCLTRGCSQTEPRPLHYMDRLCQSSLGLPWEPPTSASRRHYGAAFRALPDRVEVPPYRPCAPNHPLADVAQAQGRRMFDRLYGQDHVLMHRLRRLAQLLRHLGAHPLDPAETAPAYRTVIMAINEVEKGLSLPDVQWAGANEPRFGPLYEQLLAEVGTSCWFGPGAAEGIRHYGARGLGSFRRRLSQFSAGPTGPLLARDASGNVLLKLSENVENLRVFLRLVLDDVSSSPTMSPMLTIPRRDQILTWRPDPLTAAVADAGRYAGFAEEQKDAFEHFSFTQPAVLDVLRLGLLEKVAEAQHFQDRDEVADRRAHENLIADQVKNLERVSSDLKTVLEVFGPHEGACLRPTPYCQLAGVLDAQRTALLVDLVTLLESQHLFAPSPPGTFADWNGRSNLALTAFAQPSVAELEHYVSLQFMNIERLANEYAAPLVRGDFIPVLTSDTWRSRAPARRIWEQILRDLLELENKTPSNAPSRLSRFVLEDMPTLVAPSCADVIYEISGCSQPPVEISNACAYGYGCSFYGHRLQSLQQTTRRRCNELALQQGMEAYGLIARAFSNHLADKYPFELKPPAPPSDEVLPSDLAAFFRTFDAALPEARRLLERSQAVQPEGSATVDTLGAAATFLERLSEVRAFFAPFLDAYQESPEVRPSFGVQVQFRVHRHAEVGGSNVLRWTLELGADGTRTATMPGSTAGGLRWEYAEPAILSLRWAKQAPVRPRRPQGAPYARVDGSTLSYPYTNAWALLRLIEDHPESERSAAAVAPRTLQLEVPTVPQAQDGQNPQDPPPGQDGAAAVSESPKGARVYVRLTLTTLDEPPRALILPEFPIAAPELPSDLVEQMHRCTEGPSSLAAAPKGAS